MDFSYRLNANGGPWVDFTVTAIAGHLTIQEFAPEYMKWHSCEPFALFDAPIITKVGDVSFRTLH
jgi:DNA topoisomerase-3